MANEIRVDGNRTHCVLLLQVAVCVYNTIHTIYLYVIVVRMIFSSSYKLSYNASTYILSSNCPLYAIGKMENMSFSNSHSMDPGILL